MYFAKMPFDGGQTCGFICAKPSQLFSTLFTLVAIYYFKATFRQRFLSVLPHSFSSSSFLSISKQRETFCSYLLGFWPCLTLWSLGHFHLSRPASWRLSQHLTILLDLLLSVAFSLSHCYKHTCTHTRTHADFLPTLSESLLSVWRLWSCDWLLPTSAAAVLSAPVAARRMQLLLVVAVLSVPLSLFWGTLGVPGNRLG